MNHTRKYDSILALGESPVTAWSRTLRLGVTLAGLPALCIACSGPVPEEDSVARQSQGLYSKPSSNATYWNTSQGAGATIPVCWTQNAADHKNHTGVDLDPDAPDLPTVKTRYRRAIENTWGRVANLLFTGWDDICDTAGTRDDQTDRDLVANAGKVMFGFGAGDSTDFRGKRSNMGTLVRINATRMSHVGNVFHNERTHYRVAIHEMGHALGFTHEQQRPDDELPDGTDVCTDQRQGTTIEGGTYENRVPSGATWVDCRSIMSYEGQGTDRYRLSAGDVMGAQRRYGRKPSGSMVGYGGHCAKVNAEGERVTSAACSTSAARWDFTTVGGSKLEGVRTRAASGLAWQRTSNAASASIRGQDPAVSDLQRFAPVNMQWLALGNMCVSVATYAAGERLRLQECGGAGPERWDFFTPDARMIRLRGSNYCVQAESATPAVGDDLYLAACDSGSARQRFTFTNGGRIDYEGLCFNVFGGYPDAGAQVGLWNGCGSSPVNELFLLSGRLKNGTECVRWANGPSQELDNDLLVGECYAIPVPDENHYARPDSMSWDYYW